MASSKHPVAKIAKQSRLQHLSKAIVQRKNEYLARRPHRSFRMTRRRDYVRSLELPGYTAFTIQVARTFWKYRKMFVWLLVVYAILSAVLVGLASQSTYTTLTSELSKTGSQVFSGNWGQLGQAGLLFVTLVSGSASQTLTPTQQIYAVLLGLMVWLTTVWLLRNLLAGKKVRLRDGLYNAGAPIVATFFVFVIVILQLIPIAFAAQGYKAANQIGLFTQGGIEAALFWVAAAGLVLLSLFWLTSTLVAMVIVTQPGMYPFPALRAGGDIVVGRRMRLLLRIVWLFFLVAVGWIIIMIPVILFDSWIKSIWSAIQWLPIIPVVLLFLSSATIVWVAGYVYLLYRKVLDDGAAPA